MIWKSFKNPNLPADYFRVHVNLLRLLGIELYKKESFRYSVYSKTLLFNTVFVFTGLEIYEFFVQLQLGEFNIIELANYVLTHIMGAVETILLYMNRKKIGKMMQSLHQPPYKPDVQRGGAVEAQWIRQTIKITEAMFVLFSVFLWITILSMVFEFFYLKIMQPATSKFLMPFAPMTIGALQHTTPFYEFSVAYQMLEISVFAFIILTTYLLLSTIMAHISVQMRILANGLKHLRVRAVKFTRNKMAAKVHRKMDVLMRKSINHHLHVLNLAAEMENLCSLMILSIFFFSVLLMCFILYFASLHPIGSVEFFHFFFYWCSITSQVASYCYWGNVLSIEAEKVAQAAAEIEWPGASKHVTNAIVMIIARAQRPLYITAGKFVPLSMETLMNIIKGSFSYFMVLQQTEDGAT